MASENFERCLAITLKWEGGYSNHPDDPGGPTMRGIIQREYDAWRKKQGLRTRPVRQITDAELQAIYRTEYWDAMGCGDLPAGMDLCVFDAAVNSGVARARAWLTPPKDIDGFCDTRLAFLRGLGKLWRVFGAGWRRRVAGIREAAHAMMTGTPAPADAPTNELHAGMRNASVITLQGILAKAGLYKAAIDGIYGPQTVAAVKSWQLAHRLPVTGRCYLTGATVQ
jgi:lysozyme family protein